MTDDDRLAALFRDAASDPGAPAPGFDHGDVLSASWRITARRRTAMIGGSLAVFAVLGVGAVAVLPAPDDTASTVAAPAVEPAPERAAAPEGAAGAAPDAADAADAAGKAAQAAPPAAGAPLGPGVEPCADRQDPQLRALLEQALPEVIGAPAAAGSDECRPGAERYVTVEVDDRGRTGLFGVSYLPPGAAVDPADGGVSAPTASGGTVVVRARPVGGSAPAPFADRIADVAAFLAPRL